MSAYTKVRIWHTTSGRQAPEVSYPIGVQVGTRTVDALNIRQARTLIRQLERTIKEVQRRRSKRSSK